MRVLSQRLRELKLHRGGQRRLAELAGIAQNTLIKWRKGGGNPRLSELEQLAEALGVSVVYLISTESAETPTVPAAPPSEADAARVERLLRKAERTAQDLAAAVAAVRSAKS